VTTAVRTVVETWTSSMKSVSVVTPWGSSMSEDFETLTCRHCGESTMTRTAVDVETPVGPISLCHGCYLDVCLVPPETTEADHD
jgi:formylmethanofuran dehydrogenase subunit E